MDSGEIPANKGFHYVLLRLILTLVFPILALFLFSLFIGFLAILFAKLSVSSSISIPSQCKIVSSSVDIRSSKVCELGVLNYKAKRVFYPFERSKFRCRYDYYWACVFEVEYIDHSIGQPRLALAEAPNEALPFNCRPNFGVAWLTKHKFKVNETYDCWYTPGISKVILYRDGFFSCHAKDPSTIEMVRRYLILSTKILQSWFSSKRRAKYWRPLHCPLQTCLFSCGILVCYVLVGHQILRKARSSPDFPELMITAVGSSLTVTAILKLQ
ncbi:hypothetical protein QYF36_019834 [Acer negundo]|nr:hypothetical protein QYF36_019834 [Acer negundo]